jgi:hypothetical protein
MATFLVLLESPQQFRFDRVYFTIFGAGVKDIFWSGFCC